jgi:uncharacterized membrane protein YphA (DoxX/SURF4 family)
VPETPVPDPAPPPVPEARPAWQPWAATVVRVVLGAVALAAGASKLGDLDEAAWAVRAYDLLPDGLADLVGRVLPFAEVLLGLLLVAGLATRWAAAAWALLMLAFTVGIASVWARGMAIDCGCFGGGGPIDPADVNYLPDLLRDGGLFVLAALLAWRPASRWSLDGALNPAVLDRTPSHQPDQPGADAPGRSTDV